MTLLGPVDAVADQPAPWREDEAQLGAFVARQGGFLPGLHVALAIAGSTFLGGALVTALTIAPSGGGVKR